MAERRVTYELLTGAESGFVVKAPTLERVLIDAGLALSDTWVKGQFVADKLRKSLLAQAPDPQRLGKAWLDALSELAINERFLPKRIVSERFDGKMIQAVLFGEIHDPIRHGHLVFDATLLANSVILESISDGLHHFQLTVIR